MGGSGRASELNTDRARLWAGLVGGLAVAWTIVVFVLLWMPPPPVVIPNVWLDKATHCCLFIGVGALWRWACGRTWTVAAWALLLGALTEVGQAWLPWPRTPDVVDFAFDALGALLGVLVASWIRLPWIGRPTAAAGDEP